MGYYIETPARKGKAQWLINNAKATIIREPVEGTHDMIPVVVMDNGMFEAAGIAYSPRELKAFTDPSDTRFRMYLSVPRAEIIRLCPEVEDELKW